MDIQLIRQLLSEPKINDKYIFDPANSEDADVSAFLKKHSENKWIKFLIRVNKAVGPDGTEHSPSQLAAIEEELIKYIKDSHGQALSESVNPALQEIRGKTPEAKLVANMSTNSPIENAVNMAMLQTEKLKKWVEPKPGLLDNLSQLFSELGDKLEAFIQKLLKFSEKSIPREKLEMNSTTDPLEREAPPQNAADQIIANPTETLPPSMTGKDPLLKGEKEASEKTDGPKLG